MSYTNKGNLQKYLLTDIASSFDLQIESWISAIELYINSYTGRPDGFENTTSATRYYNGNAKRELDIDEFTSLSSVEILNYSNDDVDYTLSEGKTNDYLLSPYNDTEKTRLILTTNAQIGLWPKGDRRIKITGIFGKSTVPKDIEYASTLLVAEIIKNSRDGGVKISESLDEYSATFQTIDNTILQMSNVKKILDNYKIIELD